ncbi:MAG TPA: AraC family transcriptional regulator [Planctomycetota bacterium]|nr:AraC family transcriptional regulator [Planctomycetota bacterium]
MARNKSAAQHAATDPDPWEGVSVDLIHADLYPCPPHWKITSEVVAHSGLFYIWKGRGWLEQNGTRLEALPGDLFFSRPGVQVAAGHDPARPVTVLSTGFRLLSPAGADPLRRYTLPTRLRIPSADRGEFTARFNALVQEMQGGEPAARLSARGSALRLLAEALRLVEALPASAKAGSLAGRPGDAARVTIVLDHIDAHLAETLTLAGLAKVAHLSPVYFASLFRKETGRPPMTYVLERRIERARAMLAAGDQTIEQIAREVGFADPYHFSRAFRRKTGLPPSAYRAALKNPFKP